MNPFHIQLYKDEIEEEIRKDRGGRILIEDNPGESIHIHYKTHRLQFSVDEFNQFANEVSNAKNNL